MHGTRGEDARAADAQRGGLALQKKSPQGSESSAALCVKARLDQIAADPAPLTNQLGLQPNSAVSPNDLLPAAKHLCLKDKHSRRRSDRQPTSLLPTLALMRVKGGELRTVVLAHFDGQRVLLQAPGTAGANSRPVVESMEAVAALWTGELILITCRANLTDQKGCEQRRLLSGSPVPADQSARAAYHAHGPGSRHRSATGHPLEGGVVAESADDHVAQQRQRERRGDGGKQRHLLRNSESGHGDQIGAGMNITAEMKTGQRRVIEFLLSPIQKAGSESLRER